MAAGLATPQDVRLNEPGPICQDSKKRRPFADEYACLGMHSLRVRFRKSTHLGVNSGTKTEVSHGECENQGASPGCLSARLGYLVEEKRSARSELPSRGSIRGIPQFSCQNLVFAVYFLREETRHLLNIRRIPKHPDLLDREPAHLLDCSTARTLQSSKENEAQILN